jgi:glycosyltransferase involved in cell wall biosynthesis
MKLIKTRFVCDVRTLPVENRGTWARLNHVWFNLSMRVAGSIFDGLSVITPAMAKVISGLSHWNGRHMGVWTSGAETELFSPGRVTEEERERIREDLGLQGRYILFYHGIMGSNRGLFPLIEAVAHIRRKIPDIALVLLGDGPARNTIEKKILEMDLANWVILEDPVPFERVPPMIAAADAGVIPLPQLQWWEVSSPIKLLEYLAMEKPILVTDIEAHRHVLGKRPYAVFVDDARPELLAEGIDRLYSDRVRMRKAAVKGRQLVQDQYTWEAQARKLGLYVKSVAGYEE